MQRHSTRGFGLFALVFCILFAGGAGLAAFKIGMPYGDSHVLKGIVDHVLTESKQEPSLTNYDVAKKIFDRANVQSITLDFDLIKVKTINPGEFTVHIDLVTNIPLWKQAKIVLELPVDSVTK